MQKKSALIEAQATCDGLHRLIQRLSETACDLDKSGSGSYEMLALIASANTCVTNLGTQLTILETTADENSNVHPIIRDKKTSDKASEPGVRDDQIDEGKLKIAK